MKGQEVEKSGKHKADGIKFKNQNLILQSDTGCHFFSLFEGVSGSWA
jgi:hypothetical protein